MDQDQQEKIMQKMDEMNYTMPEGWSDVDKRQFGMSNNILSLIFGGLVVLCCLFCILCSISSWFKNRVTTGFTLFMRNPTGAYFMMLLGIAVIILNAIHLKYENCTGYSVLDNNHKENTISLSMSFLLFFYFSFRAMCFTNIRNPETKLYEFKNSTFCNMVTNPFTTFLTLAAAGTLLYFSRMQLEREEEMSYANLMMPVPEMDMSKM